jgi:hypothetical protein
MLDMMQGLGPKQQKYLITRDESWIYWDNQRRGMWAQDRDELAPNVKRTISSKRQWFLLISHSVVLFPLNSFQWGKSNSQFFVETVLPSIKKKLAECRPKLRTTAAHLHVDNAKPHTSKMSIENIEELGFILVPQSPYSLDLAPCDFFLFGYLKQTWKESI